MPIDLVAENPNPFFDPQRITRAIFDPRKNFLKTIWQANKPVLDSELNEREDIDNFIRRQILVLLAGEITIVEGLCPFQVNTPNKACFGHGEIVVRGWDLIVEKNEGGKPSTDQNFNVVVIDNSGPVPVETRFPLNGLGFSPNIQFNLSIGDNNSTILKRGTFYSELERRLCVEVENTCSLSDITYRVETLDGEYSLTHTVPAGSSRVFCLDEDLSNCVTLPIAPSSGSGNRFDFIYLQVGEVEICSTVTEVKRNGHISHRESVPANIFDRMVGEETTRRTQVQFDLRSCAGDIPPPPRGFYIYPLYRILRRPGDPFVKLEDITSLVPKIDLSKSGLFELIVRGAQITHNTVVDINDANVVTPLTVSRVVGSSINFRNAGPANRRTFSIFGEDFDLEVGESACVNFNDVGAFTLVDTGTDQNLITVRIVPWGQGGISEAEFESIRCAIGMQYFDNTHPCDDSDDPVSPSEQSLDVRIDSINLDMFEMLVCLAAARNTSTVLLSYFFVDTFIDLEFLTDESKAEVLASNAHNAGDNSIDLGGA